jgi:exopolysaccharide biosynthesis predicted pyruvyltransferase EpsI
MTFLEFLIENKDKKIFVDPCSGNNGDVLIWYGMQEVLRKARVEVVEFASQSELIVINGGGMFIDAYGQGIEKIKTYSDLYGSVPLCIAPNSYHFKTVDFGFVLDVRTSPLYLFSRESYSKKYIDRLVEKRSLISSYLDDDLAFHLIGSNRIKGMLAEIPCAKKGNILVVDRMDIEHSGARGQQGLIKDIYIALVPEFMKKFLRALRLSRRNRYGTAFTQQASALLLENDENYEIKSIETADISRPDICSFDEFAQKILDAEYIFTNRLHVGVLGYLLGRNVFMMEGSYHKIRGIYEQSMASSSHVHLMSEE